MGKHLLLAAANGRQICEISLCTDLRTKTRFVTLRRGDNRIRVPIEQAYTLADMLVGIAETIDNR